MQETLTPLVSIHNSLAIIQLLPLFSQKGPNTTLQIPKNNSLQELLSVSQSRVATHLFYCIIPLLSWHLLKCLHPFHKLKKHFHLPPFNHPSILWCCSLICKVRKTKKWRGTCSSWVSNWPEKDYAEHTHQIQFIALI